MSVTLYKMPEFCIPMSKVRDEVNNGLFAMGGSGLSYGNPTPHWVSLPEGVELSLSHVTEAQFTRVMREHIDGKDLLKDISEAYQQRWGRAFGEKAFQDHPMTCVSWDDLTVFFQIVNGVLGITDESQKYRRPTEAESEFMIRGGWVCLQEQAKRENRSIETWDQFLTFITGRFENIVSEIAITSPIFNIGMEAHESTLRDLFKSQQPLWALRVYGSSSGRLDESIWWNQWGAGRVDSTRKVAVFSAQEEFERSSPEWKSVSGQGEHGYFTEDLLNEVFQDALEDPNLSLHPYGLTDAKGNVYGWCGDDWDESAYQRQNGIANPLVKIENNMIKVVRGGSWGDIYPGFLRAADRASVHSDNRDRRIGFRCARGPQYSY